MTVYRNRLATLAAATLFGISIPVFAQDMGGTGGATGTASGTTSTGTAGTRTESGTIRDRGDAVLAPGGTAHSPDADDIRGMLAKTTEQAVSKNGFDNLINRFVDADRDRIKTNTLTDADWAKLNGRIEQLQKDWKAKYNQDFDINDDKLVYSDQVRIIEGEIGEAQPAGARVSGSVGGTSGSVGGSVGSTGGSVGGAAGDKSLPDTTPGTGSDRVGGGDANRDPGRNVAKVTVPASHGMPAVYVPLIHEMPDTWKIDVPDNVDGRKLYDNLLKHLTMFNEQKDQWPSDVNQAYLMASHHVLMAVLDTDANRSATDAPSSIDRSGTGGMDRPNTGAGSGGGMGGSSSGTGAGSSGGTGGSSSGTGTGAGGAGTGSNNPR